MFSVLSDTDTLRLDGTGRVPLAGLVVRPIRPDDAARLLRMAHRLSPQTIYRRFFSPLPALPPMLLHRFTNVDHVDREALVALDGDEIVAVVRWDRDVDHPDEAELAMLVEDAWQDRGVGRALTQLLVEDAADHQIATVIATVLSDNIPIKKLLMGILGRPFSTKLDGPQTRLRFGMAP